MPSQTNRVLNGIDRLWEGHGKKLKDYRLGLLANQASLDGNLRPSSHVLNELFPGRLKVLFGPQHGYGGVDQDNMVETDHAFDPALKLPIYSLYAESREPRPSMLADIDVLIIDLQDVGTRVYTFISTLLNCLKAVGRLGKKVVVLDRPNPLGGEVVEGNLLETDLFSFVGPYRLPMRHGLTMGEAAQVFNDVFKIGCELEIVPLKGWRRAMLWNETGIRWVMPSPNMPLFETALVYPGQVLWEGTNVSEGRGTCRPFEMFGAPYLDTHAIKRSIPPEAFAGCQVQDISFRPTFHKWTPKTCHGFFIHIIDPHVFRPFFTSMALLKSVIEIHHNHFQWKPPPYEYEYKKKPIDLIMGNSSLRRELESGVSVSAIKGKWTSELDSFIHWRRPYLIYT